MVTLSTYLFSLFLFFQVSLLVQCISSGQNELTIKLIHRDSIESPLYPVNISVEERLSRLHKQGEARIKQMALARAAAKMQTLHPDFVQPPVITDGSYYLALVGIGSPTYRPYYLMVDTGSNVIWTQCEGCDPCFKQKEPLYPYKHSTTYHQVPCQQEADCFGNGGDYCDQGQCYYKFDYMGGSTVTGAYARERFTFLSDNGATETIDDLIFGCGLNQTNFNFNDEDNQIAGILGLGTDELSLLTQLGDRANGRFSFCLQSPNSNGGFSEVSTFLRFGDAATFKPGQQPSHTPVLNLGEHFHLNLLDISIDGSRLNFPPGTFEPKPPTYDGGVIVDIGSPFMYMNQTLYKTVKDRMLEYFSRFPLKQITVTGADLCYDGGLGFNSFPTMTLHFENADYSLAPTEVFTVSPNFFCLAINPIEPRDKDDDDDDEDDDDVSVLIGNKMLTNHRIVIDLPNGEMAFANENCNLDS